MATLTLFESTLKDVVTAKRLSASKMNKLTEIALSLMENDTQLVSILYRTHKTLAPSSKINSLYVFDALARAARSKVNKLGITGDINAEKGNCATFLLKIDGILDALIQDMMSIGTAETKEKTRKILDIWTKSTTFPPSVLTRLAEVAKDSQQTDTTTTSESSAPPTDPRAALHASPAVHLTPPQPSLVTDPAQAQAFLQALLGSTASTGREANSANGSTDVQTGTNFAGLQANHVVLLQQLVERAKAGNNNAAALPLQGVSPLPVVPPPSIPVSQPTVPQVPSAPRTSTSYNSPPPSSYGSGPRDEYYGNPRVDQGHSRWNEPPGPHSPRNHEREDWYDRDRSVWRGGYRGGYRAGQTSRGARQSWRDNDDWDVPSRRPRSRSRSPPRFMSGRGNGSKGRDIRPYSPPRRPSLKREDAEATTRSIPPGAAQPGKDEFGRDIRPPSPPTPTLPKSSTTPPGTMTVQQPSELQTVALMSTQLQSSNSPPQSGGLDQVDFTTFDFSSAAAWEALGKAWEVTHGYLPSQEELMQLVVGRMAQAGIGNTAEKGSEGTGNEWKASEHQQPGKSKASEYQQSGKSKASERKQPGKSIPTYESGSNLNTNSWHGKGTGWQTDQAAFDYGHGVPPMSSDTDAVVLGGGESQASGGHSVSTGPGESSGSGGMKRVGDGWAWQPS